MDAAKADFSCPWIGDRVAAGLEKPYLLMIFTKVEPQIVI
jgi:hypothetical protein